MTSLFGADQDVMRLVTVSALEFDVVWEHLGLGELPLVLKVSSPGRTHTERAELASQAWQSLADRGLGRPVGLDPTFQRLLRLLNRPQREVDGRIWLGRKAGSLRLLLAVTGDDAVLATLDAQGVTLREAAVSGLAREALSVLPEAPPGPGTSVTLPSAQLDAAVAGSPTPPELAAALRGGGVRAADVSTIATMFSRLRRHGQFGVAARDRWGHRVRTQRVVGFFDNRLGRYLQLRRDAPDGRPWSTISPADPRLLHDRLAELIAEL